MKYQLVRKTDPATSHEAARLLDLSKFDAVVEQYDGQAFTDLEMAERLVATGLFLREESARRAVRTCREEYGMLELALDAAGEPILHRNSTGRYAQAYRRC